MYCPSNSSKSFHWEGFISFLFDLQMDQRRLNPLVQGNSLIHVGVHNLQLHWYGQFGFDIAIVFEVLAFIVMRSISRLKAWLSMRISSIVVEWLLGLAVAMAVLIA